MPLWLTRTSTSPGSGWGVATLPDERSKAFRRTRAFIELDSTCYAALAVEQGEVPERLVFPVERTLPPSHEASADAPSPWPRRSACACPRTLKPPLSVGSKSSLGSECSCGVK